MEKITYGGQAVIEGVMMRGKTCYAMAVRKPDDEIFVEEKDIELKIKRVPLFKLPIFRGIVAFLESLIVGSQIIMRSAEIAGEDLTIDNNSKFEKFLEEKCGDKLTEYVMYFSVTVSLILSISLFMLLPVFLGSFFRGFVGDNNWAYGIIEGFIRIFIFLIYMLLISRMKDVQRIFAYHGAEHKTINCLESGDELTVSNVKKYSRLHKRCGTSFLFLIMIVSMIIFLFIDTDSILLRFLSRLLLVPFVAGISYEVLKWAGRSESLFVKAVSYPGMCLQKLTTNEPDDSQIEVAIKSLVTVMDYEKRKEENENLEASDEANKEELIFEESVES